MTVTTPTNYIQYQADGIATNFSIPFLLLADNDLEVYLDNNLLTIGYSLKGVGNPISEIIFTIAPRGTLLLQRKITLLRETDYQENGDLLANTLNKDFDRLYLALQGISQDNSKTLRVEDAKGIAALSYAKNRANKLLGFDSEGQPLLINTNSGSALELAKDLADPNNPIKGAGMLGYNENLNYSNRTVGTALKTISQTIPKITISVDKPNNSIGSEGEIWLQLEEE
ncbi:hypothetical protein [Entomomonas asaccharolytica]|uniref:Uncharacterized protein n=1 Tax=Entomomonas asaccharolytica TaxID=2785331 RepID=A0A974RWQ3_9GAMM|nr:hypothetical protein [Entomomonas asaccharolytica]QQP85415.1 hypothetical protein JHT90_13705 [Entomomonas asaccharolytica]